MKKHTKHQKLRIHRETIKILQDLQIDRVDGGKNGDPLAIDVTCFPPCSFPGCSGW